MGNDSPTRRSVKGSVRAIVHGVTSGWCRAVLGASVPQGQGEVVIVAEATAPAARRVELAPVLPERTVVRRVRTVAPAGEHVQVDSEPVTVEARGAADPDLGVMMRGVGRSPRLAERDLDALRGGVGEELADEAGEVPLALGEPHAA